MLRRDWRRAAGWFVGVAFLVFLLSVVPILAETFDITPDEERLVDLTNSARSDAGLPPLRTAPELMRSAETKARDMQQRGYFSHYSPDGTSPFDLMRQAGANFVSAGENIAKGPSVDKLFAGWMKSPDHKKNILGKDYTHLGIGVVSQGGTYWAVQHFARLRGATKDYTPAAPAPKPAPTTPAPAPATPPAAPTTPAPTAPTPTQPAQPGGTYVVQPGDTLSAIAQRLGVPLWRLLVENGFNVMGELRPGQVIRIPQ